MANIQEKLKCAFDITKTYTEFENHSIVLRLLGLPVGAGAHEYMKRSVGFANGHDDPQNFSLAE
ncbi:MAG: hypothetical protein WC810_19280 [Janthinobacterium sp.]|jgi:hypothetical protein